MRQLGIIKLSTIVTASLGLGLAASMFLNFQQYQRTEQEKKLLKGEITDLRYQVAQDKIALSGQSTPAPTPSPSPSAATPSPSPTPVLGADATPAPAATATTNHWVNIRAEASTTSASLGRIESGVVVTLGAFSNKDWQEITVDNKHGYIYKTYLKY